MRVNTWNRMSLSKKTIGLFLVLGISFCLGSYVVLKLEIFPAFAEFERNSSEETLVRVTRMLESDLRALEIMNIEYSSWSDTYEYAIGRSPEYADENLDPAYWHSVNIHMMLIFDAQGNELYARFSDPVDGTALPLRDQLKFTLEAGHPLITHENIGDSLKGLINTRSGFMQVVSYPILTSEAQGPIAGALIVGQLLTDQRQKILGERSTANVSLFPIDGTNMPERALAAANHLSGSNGLTHIETVEDLVLGYQLLDDIFGAPAAILEVNSPRRISQIGTKSIQTTMFALAIASAIFLLAALWFLQRLITAPIAKLTKQILDIQESGDLRIDIGGNRADEIGVLATEFGQLTHKLSDVQVDLEAARDEALAMSKAKSEFLARMSHEIRTPMNGVLGMTELLRNTPLTDKQQRFAETIYESGESLLHIINDILDISKIEAGKIELDIAPFNMQNLVEECLDLLAESAHRKGLELACNIPVGTNVHVRGDPVRLRQVLMNLIGNALKFTQQGEVIVRVTESDSDAQKTCFRFEVEDTGIGISPENLAKVFEPFTQEDGSNTRQYGGTGLGLAISRQLVELLGGEMGVDSVQGKGSTFWFTARLARDQVPATYAQPHLLAGKSAFVVDDNETNREILRHQLEGWDIRVEVACSGSEALHLLKDQFSERPSFDIILLDMAMPGMDGLQLAKAIRKEREFQNIPIVMLSSISRANVQSAENEAGPDDWLAKPVRQSRLYETLLSLLSKTTIDEFVEEERLSGAGTNTIPNNDSTGLRVLLVDDNEINQAVANAMLESLDYEVTIANNGCKAVAAFETQMFDAVLMDCRMPEMDGFEATQRIRELENLHDRKPTPIIALTAHALQGDRERCIAAGMTDYLSKPFTKQQLRSILIENTLTDSSPTGDFEIGKFQASSAANSEIKQRPKKRILIVDDNDINRQVTQAMLESLGYESEFAKDGDKALQATELEVFDLILMDCHMPVRNGYDTTKEIRQREEQSSQSKRIPIVALTADFLESNRKNCIDSGMDDYVAKPVTEQQLRVVLDRWLVDEETEFSTPVNVDSDGFTELRDTISLESIDPAALDEIRQLDSSSGALVLREIIVSYCASSSRLMLRLRAAVEVNDVELVEQLAHSLKGGSGQLGATLLSTLCDDMISSARENDTDKLITQFERAVVEHCAVLAGLDKALQNMAA